MQWKNLPGSFIQANFVYFKISPSFKFIKFEKKFPCCVKVIPLFNNHGRLVIIDNKFQKKPCPHNLVKKSNMAAAPATAENITQVSSMPAPPMHYVKLYTDDAVKKGTVPK